MNASISQTGSQDKFWQVRSDVMVVCQANSSPARWAITYVGSNRQYVLSNTQYQALIKLEASNNPPLQQLHPRVQEYILNLANIGIIQFSPETPHLKPSELHRWDTPVPLAKWALKTHTVANRWPITHAILDPSLVTPSGCYVCLKREGQLRGCFGSITPRLIRLSDDIVQNTMAAACWDHRFLAVRPEEVDKIEISVDIVTMHEPVDWPLAWDARAYGIQLRQGTSVLATLLPNLEGLTSSYQQFEVAMEKAGISSTNELTVIRFSTLRFPDASVLPLRAFQAMLTVDDQGNSRELQSFTEGKTSH